MLFEVDNYLAKQSSQPTNVGCGKKMANVLTLMVTQCVLNQLERYWLLFDAIVATIAICYMMENKNNGTTNELMQVCDLLFGFLC